MLKKPASFLLVALALLGVHCAGHNRTTILHDKTYPVKPFRLDLRISPNEAFPGDRLTFEYVLTNTSDVSVAACLDGRSGYHMWGARAEAGADQVVLDGPKPDTVFQLPPDTSLVWRLEIKAPDVGAGPAKVYGIVNSSCELWAGTVVSSPVVVTIKSDGP